MEVLGEARTAQFAQLLLSVALGEENQHVAPVGAQLCQRCFHAGQRSGRQAQQTATQSLDVHNLLGRHATLAHADGVLDERERKGFRTVSQFVHIGHFGLKKLLVNILHAAPFAEYFAVLTFHVVEPRLAVPQRIVGIKGYDFEGSRKVHCSVHR